MNPLDFAGPALQFGGDLLGAFESRERAEDDRTLARETTARNEALQREFAQMGVRWRVDDARAAGLHPLFALSSGGAAFSPSPMYVGGEPSATVGRALSNAGQNLSRAVAAQQTEHERTMQGLAIRGAEASIERDFAQAAYWSAMASKERQENRSTAPWPSDVVTGAYSGVQTQAVDVPGRTRVESHPLFSDAVKLAPDDMVSRDVSLTGQTAGRDHPSFRQFVLPGDFKVLLPATQGGGVPEDIDLALLPFVIGANLQRYGMRWLVDAANYVTGATPAETRAQDRRAIQMLRRAFDNWQFAR